MSTHHSSTNYCPTRRNLLSTSASLALASFFGINGAINSRAFAAVEDIETLINDFTQGNTLQTGRVVLDIPDVAENGFSVPMSVTVESPMSHDDYVTSVLVLAEENPNLRISTFHFTPASGRASVSTRMRLARTQDVLALARMSDGSYHKAVKAVKVTIGGCGV